MSLMTHRVRSLVFTAYFRYRMHNWITSLIVIRLIARATCVLLFLKRKAEVSFVGGEIGNNLGQCFGLEFENLWFRLSQMLQGFTLAMWSKIYIWKIYISFILNGRFEGNQIKLRRSFGILFLRLFQLRLHVRQVLLYICCVSDCEIYRKRNWDEDQLRGGRSKWEPKWEVTSGYVKGWGARGWVRHYPDNTALMDRIEFNGLRSWDSLACSRFPVMLCSICIQINVDTYICNSVKLAQASVCNNVKRKAINNE